MASTGSAVVCIILFFPITQCVLGVRDSPEIINEKFSTKAPEYPDRIEVINEKFGMSLKSTIIFNDGSIQFLPEVNLSMRQLYATDVPENTNMVVTNFEHSDSVGRIYQQTIWTWFNHPIAAGPFVVPFACAPNCSWQVDENGFSVIAMAVPDSQPYFVASWRGPF